VLIDKNPFRCRQVRFHGRRAAFVKLNAKLARLRVRVVAEALGKHYVATQEIKSHRWLRGSEGDDEADR